MLASSRLSPQPAPFPLISRSTESPPAGELISPESALGPSSGSLTPAQLPGSGAASFRSRSHSTSSQQTPIIQLPNGFRPSSILLNARRPSLITSVSESGSSEALIYRLLPAPVVTRIPAAPTSKQREKEKEKEREKEREREKEKLRSKNKSEERIWGIPKKTLLLGLGDLNFNAQMAMLGGWGHGSGSTSQINTPVGSLGSTSSKMLTPSRKQREEANVKEDDSSDSESHHEEERLDPEELAALNAIINTRRSMAAAQALVNGCVNFSARSARAASVGSSVSTSTRPTLSEIRGESQESVPSMSSLGQSGSTSGPISPLGKEYPILDGTPALRRLSSEGIGGVETVGLNASIMGTSPSKSARIRFAPLPPSFGTSPQNGTALLRAPSADGSQAGSVSDGTVTHQGGVDAERNRLRRQDSNDSNLAGSDSDFESDDDDEKSGKGKWYLMGMPSAYFKPQYYQKSARRRSSHGKNGSVSGAGSINDDQEDGHPSFNRRKSTGSFSDLSGSESTRKRWSLDTGAADKEEEERGRSGGRPRSIGRASSSSRKSNRSTSRNGARGSGDEDERARRRELIRMARPGGTGMVTLPDGTKIRARRVNDPGLEPEIQEWGFAGLAKEASRRSAGSEGPLPSTAGFATEYFTDEVDDDMAWVRRRKREREEKAKLEKQASELAATEAAAVPPIEATDVPEETSPATAIAAEERSRDAAIAAAALTSNVSTEAVNGPTAAQEKIAPALQLVLETVPVAKSSPKMDEPVAAEPAPALPQAKDRRSANLTDEPPSLTGSGILARTDSRPGVDKSGPSKGLALSADQAEEIRRRHEDEVCALGAEVLAQTRRNVQRRATSGTGATSVTTKSVTRNASVHAGTTQSSPSRAGRSNSTTNSGTTSLAGSRLISRTSSREASTDGRRTDELQPLSAIPRQATQKDRKTTGDSERTILFSSPLPDAGEEMVSSPTELEHPLLVLSTPSSSLNLPAEISTKRDSSPSESVISRQSSIIIHTESPYTSQYATISQSSSLHAPPSSASTFSASPKARRISLDPSISVPAPSPWLPLRPDARGKAVVPLPQLGIRPERPREGRVWQYDVSDDSASESDVHDEDEDDLNAEELEEEERKTAMQKKRATTRAAGQEVVHSRSDAERRVSITPGKKKSPSRHVAPKFVRPAASSSSVKTTSTRGYSDVDLESETEEVEKDMWPAVSAASRHNGTPKPRHIMVNLPGGPGIWDSKKGGGATSVPAINSVAAARAKAVKQRAKKQKEFQLPPDWDDEMMDYGWPRSLKGSLY